MSLLVCFAAADLRAAEHRGELQIDLAVTTPTGVHYFPMLLRWWVGTMMGEPIIVCRAAWHASTQQLRRAWEEYDAPSDIVDRTRVIEVQVAPRVLNSADPYGAGFLPCDVGVMTFPTSMSIQEFRNLSASQQKPFMSYNAPGSPPWNQVLRDSTGSWIAAERAQEIIRQPGFTLDGFWSGKGYQLDGRPIRATGKLVNGKISSWRAQEKWKAVTLERQRLEAAREKARLQRYGKKESQKSTSGGDFWDTPHDDTAVAEDFWAEPANPLTVGEQREDAAISERLAQLEKQAESGRGEERNHDGALVRAQEAFARRMAPNWCQEARDRFWECISTRCGARPGQRFFITVKDMNDTKRCDARCEREANERSRREAAERAAEMRRWDDCERREAPQCGPPGVRDTDQCVKEQELFMNFLRD